MGSGRLFHIEGPLYNKVFCPVRKGYISLGKLFPVSIPQCRASSKILFRWKGQFFQFIDLSPARDICCHWIWCINIRYMINWIPDLVKKFDHQAYCQRNKVVRRKENQTSSREILMLQLKDILPVVQNLFKGESKKVCCSRKVEIFFKTLGKITDNPEFSEWLSDQINYFRKTPNRSQNVNR